MSKAVKLRSAETLKPNVEIEKKQNPNRNPLKELNSSSSTSVEPPKGCFRFLLSNSSSKTTFPKSKSKSLPKTPHSAPTSRALPYKSAPTSSNPRFRLQINPTKPSFENPKKTRSKCHQNPGNPSLLQLRNGKKPSSDGQFRERVSQHRAQTQKASAETDKGKTPNLSFRADLDSNGICLNKLASGSATPFGSCLVSPDIDTVKPPTLSFRGVLEENQTPLNKVSVGSFLVSSPEKDSEECSTTTPPVQASISPEIPCGSDLISTPACFGAGHMVAGVSDKRKCKPRGILTVGDELVLGFSHNDPSRPSLATTPYDASMHWLVSNSKGSVGPVKDGAVKGVLRSSDGCSTVRLSMVPSPPEASINWFSSPCEDSNKGVLENGSPEIEGLVDPTTSFSEATPSTSGLSSSPTISGSPCSLALEGPAVSYGSKVLMPLQEKGYRYNLMLDNSPFSGDSQGSLNIIGTPSSDLSSNKQLGLSWMNTEDLSDCRFEINSMAEVLQTTSLSPKSPLIACESTDVLPLPGLNFQFSFPATPSNAMDGTQFQKPLYDMTFGSEEYCRREYMTGSNFEKASQVRISWREGLVSRIFDMDEPDFCQWLSEEEDNFDSCGNNQCKSDFGLEFDLNLRNSTLSDENDMQLIEGFGSPEFIYDERGDRKSKAKLPQLEPISCAESISTEGGGLVASDDSDWTLCYKNKLFEG
ncbi:GPI-anchored adhesin-like protein [Tasmannia lanceolata]|uniref:GPI-anchored adhesin-like protein n=1 Tax=Tasmannia lanceolata TaxID=3420 RepID=UPI004063BBDA